MSPTDLKSGVLFALALSGAAVLGYGVSQLRDNSEIGDVPALITASAPAPTVSSQTAQVSRADDGHYWAEADINGRAVRVLVDTGASVVALTRDDALRLGFMLESEDFDHTVVTANGEGRAARIELAHVAVAGARVERVQALVVERGLPASLLGMSYLGRLSRIEATPHSLTLRP